MEKDMTLSELVLYVSKLEERIETLENKTIKKSGIVLSGVKDSHFEFIEERKKRLKELTNNE
jgi:hypothetical protein